MTADEALRHAARRLSASPSARLDAEVLLMHAHGVDRTWLYTWGDRELPAESAARFEALIERRVAGWPVAYLTGRREFWGLELDTSPVTLIPRPDTERLVEAALAVATTAQGTLLDLGTGTGAVALAFASERPDWHVLGADVEPQAVALASANGARLGLTNARFVQSDWFGALAGERFAIIVANPPYIDADDPHLGRDDVRFEPRRALVAADAGLADLRALVASAPAFLEPGGWLWLEHGHTQAGAVRALLGDAGYGQIASLSDLGGHERVSGGRWG
ncbi:peptide chain release factor N(5)-glutamine methyltransferase [Salinicola sp. JS01]|uniref:peptide chain release factor N(5)-glutamine methyltransferase n=1 Tax=Salinicola sp. JS01 TaxID=3050071 RepID=UPI00255C19BF|nr:peptide chain release factor N(5)-glutamine methyltransferase [Salinicola sp. JS01]WIX34872.1 peptide chain release factor N(5)-glutamine methyltransferase [Salinicola sp. JS01]